jgi:16S rRNA (cytidine1402-2'-O)-methyltransferase
MDEKEKKVSGKLYVISTPIGNPDDITLRAMNLLKLSDAVICEEIKEGAKLMRHLNLDKELIEYNEHSDHMDVLDIVMAIGDGKKYALISDCGTPLLADPGLDIVKNCISQKIEVEVAPGASSVLTALVRSGFETKEFIFAGFLGRTDSERKSKLKKLAKESRTIILLETPYRLQVFLESAKEVLPNRQAYIGFNLTHAYESHSYGTFSELSDQFRDKRMKAEFVVVFEGSGFDFSREKDFDRSESRKYKSSDDYKPRYKSGSDGAKRGRSRY